MRVKHLDTFSVQRIIFTKIFLIFGKGCSPVQIVIPLLAIYVLHDRFYFRVGICFTENVSGIPFDEDVPEIENDVFNFSQFKRNIA